MKWMEPLERLVEAMVIVWMFDKIVMPLLRSGRQEKVEQEKV